MKEAPKVIPMAIWLSRTEDFLSKHANEYSRTTQALVKEMFTLYNDQCLPTENGMFCSKCCGRVFNKLKKHYLSILAEQEALMASIPIDCKTTENNGDTNTKEDTKEETNKIKKNSRVRSKGKAKS